MPVHTGAMIALLVPEPEPYALYPPTEQSTPADELHITLAYLGEASEITQEEREALLDACQILADTSNAPEALFPATTGIFPPKDKEASDVPYYATPQPTDEFAALREDLVTHLSARGVGSLVDTKFPVFQPHVTLTYAPIDDAPDLSYLPTPTPTTFATLICKFADEVHTFHLRSKTDGPDLPITASVQNTLRNLSIKTETSEDYLLSLYLKQRQVRSTPTQTRAQAAINRVVELTNSEFPTTTHARLASLVERASFDPNPATKALTLNRALALAASASPETSQEARELASLKEQLHSLVADGNSSLARSLRARAQLRDRFGRWIEMGGGIRFKIRTPGVGTGSKWQHGIARGIDVDNQRVHVELEDGRTVAVPASKVEQPKAILGLQTETSPRRFTPRAEGRPGESTETSDFDPQEEAEQKALDDSAVAAMERVHTVAQDANPEATISGGHIAPLAFDKNYSEAAEGSDTSEVTFTPTKNPLKNNPLTVQRADMDEIRSAVDRHTQRNLNAGDDETTARSKAFSSVASLFNERGAEPELTRAPRVRDEELEDVETPTGVEGQVSDDELVAATSDSLEELNKRIPEDHSLRSSYNQVKAAVDAANGQFESGQDSREDYLANLDRIKEFANSKEPAFESPNMPISEEQRAFGAFAEDVDNIHQAADGVDAVADAKAALMSADSLAEDEGGPEADELRAQIGNILNKVNSGDYLQDAQALADDIRDVSSMFGEVPDSEPDRRNEVLDELELAAAQISPEVSEAEVEEPETGDNVEDIIDSEEAYVGDVPTDWDNTNNAYLDHLEALNNVLFDEEDAAFEPTDPETQEAIDGYHETLSNWDDVPYEDLTPELAREHRQRLSDEAQNLVDALRSDDEFDREDQLTAFEESNQNFLDAIESDSGQLSPVSPETAQEPGPTLDEFTEFANRFSEIRQEHGINSADPLADPINQARNEIFNSALAVEEGRISSQEAAQNINSALNDLNELYADEQFEERLNGTDLGDELDDLSNDIRAAQQEMAEGRFGESEEPAEVAETPEPEVEETPSEIAEWQESDFSSLLPDTSDLPFPEAREELSDAVDSLKEFGAFSDRPEVAIPWDTSQDAVDALNRHEDNVQALSESTDPDKKAVAAGESDLLDPVSQAVESVASQALLPEDIIASPELMQGIIDQLNAKESGVATVIAQHLQDRLDAGDEITVADIELIRSMIDLTALDPNISPEEKAERNATSDALDVEIAEPTEVPEPETDEPTIEDEIAFQQDLISRLEDEISNIPADELDPSDLVGLNEANQQLDYLNGIYEGLADTDNPATPEQTLQKTSDEATDHELTPEQQGEALEDIASLATVQARSEAKDAGASPEEVDEAGKEIKSAVEDEVSDYEPKTPAQLEDEDFPANAQQQVIYDDAAFFEKDVLVAAKAGTGKTTTLVGLAKRIKELHPDKKGIYGAFNRSTQVEGEARMPDNMDVRTWHKMAFNHVSKAITAKAARKSAKNANGEFVTNKNADIADIVGVSGQGYMQKAKTAKTVRQIIDNFSRSGDASISEKHFINPDGRDISANWDDAKKQEFLTYAQNFWSDVESPNGKIKVNPDHVRKVWALSNPDFSELGYDFIFVDEAQDTPPVIGELIAAQEIQKVVVGDKDQSINGWAGAVDYLSKAGDQIENWRPLTVSYRYDGGIQDIANRFLEFLGSPERVIGGGPADEIGPVEAPDARLYRTNAGVIAGIAAEIGSGRKVGVPKGTKGDFIKLVQSVKFLQDGRTWQGKKYLPGGVSEEIDQYGTWQEFVKEAEAGDAGAAMIFKLFNEQGYDSLIDLMKNVYDPAEEGIFQDVDISNQENQMVVAGNTFLLNDTLKKITPTGKGFTHFGFKFQKDADGARWVLSGDSEAQQAAWNNLNSLLEENNIPTGSGDADVDVVVTTAHKSKGLEWDSVVIGEDFRQPELDEQGNISKDISDEEKRLAYVSVTRAKSQLDPGSLSWIYEFTQEDGGDPSLDEIDLPKITQEPDLSVDREAFLDSDVMEDVSTTPDPGNGVSNPEALEALAEAEEQVEEATDGGEIPADAETEVGLPEDEGVEPTPTGDGEEGVGGEPVSEGVGEGPVTGEDLTDEELDQRIQEYAQGPLAEYLAEFGSQIEDETIDKVNGSPWVELGSKQVENMFQLFTELPPIQGAFLEDTLNKHIDKEASDDDLIQAISTVRLMTTDPEVRDRLSSAQAGIQVNQKPLIGVIRTNHQLYGTEEDGIVPFAGPDTVKAHINAVISQHAFGQDLDFLNENVYQDTLVRDDLSKAFALMEDAKEAFTNGEVFQLRDLLRDAVNTYDNLIDLRKDADKDDKLRRRLFMRRRAVDEILAAFEGREPDPLVHNNWTKFTGASFYRGGSAFAFDNQGSKVYYGDKITKLTNGVENQTALVIGTRYAQTLGGVNGQFATLDPEKKTPNNMGTSATRSLLAAVGPNNPLYHDPDYDGPRISDEEWDFIQSERSDKGDSGLTDFNDATGEYEDALVTNPEFVALAQQIQSSDDLTTLKSLADEVVGLFKNDQLDPVQTATLAEIIKNNRDALKNNTSKPALPDFGESPTPTPEPEGEEVGEFVPSVGMDLAGHPNMFEELKSLPQGTQIRAVDEFDNETIFERSITGWDDAFGTTFSGHFIEDEGYGIVEIISLPGDGPDNDGGGGGESPDDDGPLSGDGPLASWEAELLADDAIAKATSAEEVDILIQAVNDHQYLDANQKENLIKEAEIKKATMTGDIPEQETTTSPFTPLPADQLGKSGDGWLPDGSWGKYGAAGIAITATDPADGKKKVLIGQRGNDNDGGNANKWLLPGGALEENETPQQGAARELLEELVGITEEDLATLQQENEDVFEKPSGWKYTTLTANLPNGVKEVSAPENASPWELVDFKWVDAEELAQMDTNGELIAPLSDGKLAAKAGLSGDAVDEIEPPVPSVDDISKPAFNITDWKKIGSQTSGSNVGGFYESPDGKQYFVKTSPSPVHAANEVLASYIYEKMGVSSARAHLATNDSGSTFVASELVPGAKQDLLQRIQNADTAYLEKLQADVAVDAWLGNYDVAGLAYENIQTDTEGNPVRIDPGGAMGYRAQGKKKAWWGYDGAGDLHLLTGGFGAPSSSYGTASKIFGPMDPDEIQSSAKKLLGVDASDIKSWVQASGLPEAEKAALIDTLIKRRHSILTSQGLLSDGGNKGTDLDAALTSAAEAKKSVPQEFNEGDLVALPSGDKVTIKKVSFSGQTVFVNMPNGTTGVFPSEDIKHTTNAEDTSKVLLINNNKTFKVGDEIAVLHWNNEVWAEGTLTDQKAEADPDWLVLEKSDGTTYEFPKYSSIVHKSDFDKQPDKVTVGGVKNTTQNPIELAEGWDVDLPEGAEPLYTVFKAAGEVNTVLVRHEDGSLHYYSSSGKFAFAGGSGASLDAWANSDKWHPWEPPTSTEATAETASGVLPDGYAAPPEGAVVRLTNNAGSPWFIVEHTDGSLWAYGPSQSKMKTLNDSIEDIMAGSPSYTPVDLDTPIQNLVADDSVPILDALGMNLSVGDQVTAFGASELSGEVVGFTPSGRVKVRYTDADGKTRTASRLPSKWKKTNTSPITASNAGSIPRLITSDPDPDHPLYKTPKPERPLPPSMVVGDFVDSDWLEKAQIDYDLRQESKHPEKAGKSIQESSLWTKYEAVQKYGAKDSLDSLLKDGYLSEEVYQEALESINVKKVEVSKLEDSYKDNLQSWKNQLVDWNKANGQTVYALHDVGTGGMDAPGLKFGNSEADKYFNENFTYDNLTQEEFSAVSTQKGSSVWQSAFRAGSTTTEEITKAKKGSLSESSILGLLSSSSRSVWKNIRSAARKTKTKDPVWIVREVGISSFHQEDGSPFTSSGAGKNDLTKMINSIQKDLGVSEASPGYGPAGAFSGYSQGNVEMNLLVPEGVGLVWTKASTPHGHWSHQGERGVLVEPGVGYYVHHVEKKGSGWRVFAEVIPPVVMEHFAYYDGTAYDADLDHIPLGLLEGKDGYSGSAYVDGENNA